MRWCVRSRRTESSGSKHQKAFEKACPSECAKLNEYERDARTNKNDKVSV